LQSIFKLAWLDDINQKRNYAKINSLKTEKDHLNEFLIGGKFNRF